MTATKQDVSAEALRLFASDLEAYGKVCLKIRTKQATVENISFNASQRLVHEALAAQYRRTGRVRAIILKARQQGMSTYTAARFFRKLHLWPNHNAVVIADEVDRAQTLFTMYDRYHDFLPDEVRPMKRYGSKKKELYFDNPKDAERGNQPGLGSGISIETAGDTAAGRGSTIQLAHLSEMAFWPNALDVYVSMIQAVPDKGSEVIIESTANGVGNLFHQMWLQAEEGEGKTEGGNGYVAIFIPWWWHEEYTLKLTPKERRYMQDTLDERERELHEDGVEFRGERHKLTLGQLAWRRQTIREKMHGDERIFRQEYPATPEEAFLASGSCFFNEEDLKRLNQRTESPKRRGMLVSIHDRGVILSPSELGYLRVWKRPGEDDNPDSPVRSIYVIAADTASGKQVAASHNRLSDPEGEQGGRDFCSADVIDVVRREQVAQLHGRMAPEIFAEQLNLLGRFYSTEQRTGLRTPALLVPEKNHSSGETVLHLLKNVYQYPNLYRHKRINRRFNRPTDTLGWVTTTETRMPMLDTLAACVRDDSLRIYSADTIREMFTFVRGDDGKPQAQEGAHDDRVISIGIGAYVMEQGGFELARHTEEADQDDDRELVSASPTGWFDY